MSTLIASVLAGLAGTPHCVGMCGGFAAANASRARDGVAWHMGRLATYAALGALTGAASELIPLPVDALRVVSAVFLVAFALQIAGVVHFPVPAIPGVVALGAHLRGRPTIAARFAFGMVNGLLPCGLVYAALSLAMAAATPVGGALAMVAFGLGTVPGLAVLGVGLHTMAWRRRPWVRRALAVGVVVAGLWAVWSRPAPATWDEPPPCHDDGAVAQSMP